MTCENCGAEFNQKRRNIITCSRKCRNAHYQRKYYANHRSKIAYRKSELWHKKKEAKVLELESKTSMI